jgi:hypothetical protein
MNLQVISDRSPAENQELWRECQRIAWPRKSPSEYPPFAREICAPWRRPASWLYYTLLDDPELRAAVLQRRCVLCDKLLEPDYHHASCQECVDAGELQ